MDYIHALKGMGKKGTVQFDWLLFLGIINVLLGVAAVSFTRFSTMLSMLYLGWLLIFSGVATVYFAFGLKHLGGHWTLLAFGTLAIVCGSLMLINPLVNAAILTAVAAVYLFTIGLVSLFSCFMSEHDHKPWVAFSAVASILCAYIIYSGWPFTGTWVLGTFLGLYLFFHGISQIQIGLAGKRLLRTA